MKARYKDYKKSSEYFTDKETFLSKDIERTEKQKEFIVWVQEFSKKIVVIAFIIYIINNAASLIAIYISISQGNIYGLDTFISESNQTFREVVGGYIIKSAIENAFKIAGNYFIGICDARLKVLKTELKKDGIDGIDDSINPYKQEEDNIQTQPVEQNNQYIHNSEIIEYNP